MKKIQDIVPSLNRRHLLLSGFAVGLASVAAAAKAAIPESAWKVVEEEWQRSPFGPADEVGAANRITPELVRRALALPQSGQMIALGLPLDEKSPGYPPRKFEHYSIQNIGTDASNNDDFIDASLNTGTQIDGLAHLGVDGVFYNGNRAEDFVTMDGLKKLGTENIPPMLTRGLLLDIVALKGRRMEGGEAILVADIQAALSRQNLPEPEAGDIVLFHTGWMEHWREGSEMFWKSEPGPGIEAARWLAERQVVAVGNDTSRLEVDPFEAEGLFYPVHQILLAENGIYILENINTQALVDAGSTNRPFLLVVSPLPVVGASQTWVNPIAVL